MLSQNNNGIASWTTGIYELESRTFNKDGIFLFAEC